MTLVLLKRVGVINPRKTSMLGIRCLRHERLVACHGGHLVDKRVVCRRSTYVGIGCLDGLCFLHNWTQSLIRIRSELYQVSLLDNLCLVHLKTIWFSRWDHHNLIHVRRLIWHLLLNIYSETPAVLWRYPRLLSSRCGSLTAVSPGVRATVSLLLKLP